MPPRLWRRALVTARIVFGAWQAVGLSLGKGGATRAFPRKDDVSGLVSGNGPEDVLSDLSLASCRGGRGLPVVRVVEVPCTGGAQEFTRVAG